MAKQYVQKTQQIKAVGLLDKNEDGAWIIRCERDDKVVEYALEDILNEMYGSEITFASTETLSD